MINDSTPPFLARFQGDQPEIANLVKRMAIFGEAVMLFLDQNQTIEHVLRDGNNWDIFLNYFFAVFFIFCFIIGILLNPFIIAYHAQQKRTFAKVLFPLVSSMDLFKSMYFPLVLVPKLLSPLGEDDYYINEDLTTVSWTTHLNTILAPLSNFEIDVLVVLCVVRYNSVVHPLSSTRVRNMVLLCFLISNYVFKITMPFLPYFHEPMVRIRILDSMIISDQDYNYKVALPLAYVSFGANSTLLLIGGVYTILTIQYLKNSDTAFSEASRINIRKGTISLVAMNLFNMILIISNLGHGLSLLINHTKDQEDWSFSTGSDFIQFANFYFTPVIQSAFNAVSFLLICSSFRIYAMKRLYRGRTVNPSIIQ